MSEPVWNMYESLLVLLSRRHQYVAHRRCQIFLGKCFKESQQVEVLPALFEIHCGFALPKSKTAKHPAFKVAVNGLSLLTLLVKAIAGIRAASKRGRATLRTRSSSSLCPSKIWTIFLVLEGHSFEHTDVTKWWTFEDKVKTIEDNF